MKKQIDSARERMNGFSQAFGNLLISGAILLLAVSTLVIRFGSAKYPSSEPGGK